MAATTKQAEEYLQKIRRLPSNKICANCRISSRLGFGAVCVKYQSFVCDLCKSAHQSFSHRTKSVTMSTWTMDEVKALDEKNGGGNDCCRSKWFAKLSSSDESRYCPKEGEPLDKFKRFVQLAYEDARWYDENGKPSQQSSSTPAVTEEAKTGTRTMTPPRHKPNSKLSGSVQKVNGSKSNVGDEDLLVLDFDAKVSVTAGSASNHVGTAPADDEWGSFAVSGPSTPVKTPPFSSAAAAVPAAADNEWGSFESPAKDDNWAGFPATTATTAAASRAFPMSPLTRQSQTSASSAPAAFPPMMTSPQAQMPGYGFPSMPSAFPSSPGTIMQPKVGFVGTAPVAGFPPAVAQPPVNDPFYHLSSFNSAPAVMVPVRSSSAPIGVGLMMAPGGGTLPRSTSQMAAAIANDPFAHLM